MEKRCSTSRVEIHGGGDLNRRRIEFSDDAKWMFVCCGSHVKVYSYSSRRVVYTLAHHTKEVTGITLHPKKRMQLLSSSLDGQLALWDYTDGVLLRVIELATPLFWFGIRPGRREPLLFFAIEQDSKHVMVGVSSHVITERQPAVAPSNQLTEAQRFLTSKTRRNGFAFSSEGAYLATYDQRKLVVCDLEAETEYKYSSDFIFTALAFHPSKLCIATGNRKGKIQLWYDFARRDRKVMVTTFHWHAHSVWDLCFTTDGTYLLSGGEESVLVLWQLDTHSQQFRPRLGSPITRVACSPGDGYFCVSLQSNVIHLISGMDTDIKCTLGGLRKAYTQTPDEHGIETGLVLEPRSNSIVLNSIPGFIQFYQPKTDSLVYELDVTGLNYISRPDDKPLTLTTVAHVAMATDGLWLATVEERDDGHTAPELRMKFWEFNANQQCFTLNTCVEPPHDRTVTSLTFQPKQIQTGTSFPYMAVTTSTDGKFKMWVVVDSESSGRGRKRKKGVAPYSWACRSMGDYLGLPCHGSVFCEDGSLLALNFHKYVTVWEPHSCDLRVTFNSQFPQEEFKNVVFGHGSSSQYLLASTSSHLHTWNLLTCTVLWSLQVSVSLLVSDPFSSMTAAFVTTEGEKTSHLYLFEPSNPTPLAVHGAVCQGCVIGGVFLPNEDAGSTGSGSKLYFMNKNQVLYAVHDETDSSQKTATQDEEDLSPVRTEPEARSSFYEIFGDALPGKTTSNLTVTSQPSTKSRNFALKVLGAPPHVLPPMDTLCQSFLSALLPLNKHSGDSILTEGEDNLSEYSDADGHSNSESESEEGQSEGALVEPTDSNDGVGTAMEVDEESLKTTALDSVGNYDWLIDHFCQNH